MLKASHIPIVDADVIARQVVEPGTPALHKIQATFGKEVINPDGTLDRKKLGSIIFNDEVKRKQLNKIVHPAVRRAMFWQVVTYWLKGHKYCIMDVPLLIEGGLWKWVGMVVVVYWCVHSLWQKGVVLMADVCSSDELQLQRLMLRDNSSREEATSRLNAQIPISQKVSYADYVIDNSGTKQELEANIDRLIRRLDDKAGWSWRLSWIPPVGAFMACWTLAWKNLMRKRNGN